MDQSVLFVVDNDRLHHFVTRDELGADVISVLQSDLGVTVGETVLPIAHWEHDRTGPLSVAVNFAGELVILVVADTFTDEHVLLNTLSTLEQWLAPMDLRDLGELSGDPTRFVEGLWELSPRSPIALASMMRVLLINPTIDLDPDTVSASLPFSRLEVLRIDALEAADGTVTIRRAHERSDSFGESLPLHDSSPITIHLDAEPATPTSTASSTTSAAGSGADEMVEAEIVEADEAPEADIDLTVEPATTPKSGDWPTIIRGSQYVTAELPLHFDPTGAHIEPISDELFAMGRHLALIVDLDRHEASPIETQSIFRWDSSPGQRELFAYYELDDAERQRTIHLFVEGSSASNRVFYLGTANQLAQNDPSEIGTTWLRLNTPLDDRWFEPLRDQNMPPSTPPPAFESTYAARAAAAPTRSERGGTWVPTSDDSR